MERMASTMWHRGPDAQGVWVDRAGRVAMCHRRLSIIDLDPRANQPMQNEDGSIRVTFNGEIYNYQLLRRPLESSGRHQFETASDTEVLLHLYEEVGRRDVGVYLNSLRGMFAFGLWDVEREHLLLARDPLGKKPLYYAETVDGLVFASTIRALLQDASLPRGINRDAIDLYLTLGYIPAPWTAFDRIRKLQAGHYLLADRTGIRKIERYWAPDFEPKLGMPVKDVRLALMEEVKEATRLRMISDVPLGVFLSGGLDSSTIVALASRFSPQSVKTFSVAFDGSPEDESQYARVVAEYFGCDHTELRVELKPESLPDLVREYEEPFADPAAIPTYFMAKVARRHVTVVLNGDGGDEDFAGYSLRHLAYGWAEWARLPSYLRRCVLAVSRALPASASEAGIPHRGRKSLRILGEMDWRRNVALMEIFPRADLLPWLQERGRRRAAPVFELIEALWPSAQMFDGLDRELYFSFALHLPEQLLVKVDRACMAWSLEARSPLLDREVVEFCARIPASYKLRGLRTKHIFREALRGLLPAEVLDRGKQGFIPPMDEWLRHALRPLLEDCLLAPRAFVTQILRPDFVRGLVRQHLDARRDHQRRLYTLLNLEVWAREFRPDGVA